MIVLDVTPLTLGMDAWRPSVARERVDARNKLETYVYQVKSAVDDGNMADKMDADEKEKVEEAIREANEWIDMNSDADKEDFEEKLKDLEDECSPVISAVYQRGLAVQRRG
jgi:molecular chaperone DnaK (HSP70)